MSQRHCFTGSEISGWQPFRLGKVNLKLGYDITALHWLGDRWIIGSPIDHGNYALQIPPESNLDGRPWLEESKWQLGYIHLGEDSNVTRILATGESIVAASDTVIALSQDGGEQWEIQNQFRKYEDIELFDGTFYLLMKRNTEDSSNLDLYESIDGIIWNILQTLSANESWGLSDLTVISDVYNHDGLPPLEENRLLMTAVSVGKQLDNKLNASVSMGIDGTWFDHGSSQSMYEGEGVWTEREWNPLQLPESHRYQEIYRIPDIPPVHNLSIYYDALVHYENDIWNMVFQTRPESTFSNKYTAAWGGLATIYDGEKLLWIQLDGNLMEFALPSDEGRWEQLISIGGTFYLVSSSPSKLFSTQDFIEWNEIPVTGHTLELVDQGNQLAVYCLVNIPIVPINWREPTFQAHPRMLIRENDDWTRYSFGSATSFPTFHPYRIGHYDPASKKWYYIDGDSLYEYAELDFTDYIIDSTSSFFASLNLETWWGRDPVVTSPDNERLFAYGSSAEFVIADLDGTTENYHSWRFFPTNDYQINSIKWVNGWYYILGPNTIRTRDFSEYEVLSTPNGEAFTNVVGSGDYLYGFVQGAVFRKPLNKGFLDSVELRKDWHVSQWLGWFQIINEELGDIDHLLLGKCWVKQENDLEYWIRTSTLGWIYMRKDWSPWLWRMDDGHWYWLDQDSWPPRAWDHEDQERELL